MAAIYQWFPGKLEVLTSTLYPIEVIEHIDFTVSLEFARMEEIPLESFDVDGEILSFFIEEVQYYLPLQEEAYDVDGEILDFEIERVLFYLPLQEEAYDVTGEILDFEMDDIRIEGLMPTEAIDFRASLVSASMTTA